MWIHRLFSGLRRLLGQKARGQGTLEFALVLPIFLWIVVGIVDLGRGVAAYSLLANSAREGARAGIIPQTGDAEIIAAVNSQTLFLGILPSGNIAISPSDQDDRTDGEDITVAVTYQFQPITPLLASVVGSSITMHGTSTMLIE